MSDPDNITRANACDSPLLKLPAELRNRIYASVFGEKIFVQFSCVRTSSEQTITADWAILQTCKQIRYEAISVPIFHFKSLPGALALSWMPLCAKISHIEIPDYLANLIAKTTFITHHNMIPRIGCPWLCGFESLKRVSIIINSWNVFTDADCAKRLVTPAIRAVVGNADLEVIVRYFCQCDTDECDCDYYIANRENSPFLHLPAEIRNQIYDLTITKANQTVLSLLVTCTQINHEAFPLLYSNVSLWIKSPKDIYRALYGMDMGPFSRITSIETVQWYTLTGSCDLVSPKEDSLEQAVYMEYAKKLSGVKQTCYQSVQSVRSPPD
ncbi:hypothetical protein PTNB29_06155 [Pyrenophora teres f. teres]|nr:hypothetical protein PTNB29_06155 [Pyrenophora teres f. teres]